MIQNHVLIFQHRQAQPADFPGPRVLTRIVLVVAGDEVGAMTGGQARQGRRMPGQLRHRAVAQVTGHGDQVRPQAIDPIDQLLHETALDGRTHVHVAELGDGKPMQPVGKTLDGNVDVYQPRPARHGQAHRRRGERQHHHAVGGGAGQRGESRRGNQPTDTQQCRVAQQGQHEQGGEEPHGRVPQPGQRIGKLLAADVADPDGQRNEHDHREQQHDPDRGAERPVGEGRQQPPAQIARHGEQQPERTQKYAADFLHWGISSGVRRHGDDAMPIKARRGCQGKGPPRHCPIVPHHFAAVHSGGRGSAASRTLESFNSSSYVPITGYSVFHGTDSACKSVITRDW